MNFLLKYLASKQAIVDRLSSPSFGVKIYKRRAPQNCPRPFVVVTEISGSPDYELAGEIGDLPKVVQVDVYADTDLEAQEISELIRLAPLSGYRGLMDTTYVHAVTIESELAPDDFLSDAGDTPTSRSTKTYRVHHDRAVVHSS
jgi:hypothetical protein